MHPIASVLIRFYQKRPLDQVSALKATVRHLWRSFRSRRFRAILKSDLVAPLVTQSSNRLYLAYRPDWEFCLGHLPELRQLAPAWVAYNVENNAGDLPRLYSLLLNVNQVLSAGVEGDLAELGVYRGNSAAVLAHYARRHGRSLYLFDTYEGFAQDDMVGIDANKEREFGDTSLELVKETVGPGPIHYIQGYFPGTVDNRIAATWFAVVHLDCDLYAPMKAGLEFFFERLSPGGLLIIHDYANPFWGGVKQAVDEFLQNREENLIILPDKSGTAMIRKLFRSSSRC
jgi:hypothetical protein